MATPTTKIEARCATCGKAAATCMCLGCSMNFCLRHLNEHRAELAKQMDEDIFAFHDQIRQNFDEQTKESDHHPLMKRIDDWEQAAHEKIHQTANDARQQLLNAINKYNNNIKVRLENITQELKTARDGDNFFETDLKEWLNQLDALRKDSIAPQTITVHCDNSPTSFISRILIGETADDYFEPYLGNIRITNNGKVITHNQINEYASARGRREYLCGEHCFRFVIENLSKEKWIFLGILSKSAPASKSPAIGTTSYGFSGGNNVWFNGRFIKDYNAYKSDFETNDTVELLINCDQRKISLTNVRTQIAHTLDVDIVKCPFPWKLTIGFYNSPGERIRILS
jgi:hypothetical protein